MSSDALHEQEPLTRSERFDIYKTTIETWRSQVDSSWQRSSFYAAFETAAIGGCWFLVKDTHRLSVGTAIAVSLGGFALTAIWERSTKKTWEYVHHWWKSIISVEAGLNLNGSGQDFARQLEESGTKSEPRYRVLARATAWVFGLAWIALFIASIVRLTWLEKCPG